MCATTEKIDWEDIVSLYNTIKSLYALCEETDPELNTNLQPLNEFRAALDHLMRIVGIEKTDGYNEKSAVDESQKLRSHLRRALFDICDMISINYRTKIIDVLEDYEVDEINSAIPTYYSKMRPRIEEISEGIAALRTEKRFNTSAEEETAVDEYPKIIEELKGYYKTINKSIPSLLEIKEKNKKKARDAFLVQKVIPIGSIVVAIVIAIIGWIVPR